MSTTTPVATDFGQFSKLRAAARAQDPQALHAAAKQFEALFTQQLLKAMRAASLGEDLMGGEQMEFYQDMFDQQLAVHLSAGKGLGIADVMIRQLQAAGGAAAGSAAIAPAASTPVEAAKTLAGTSRTSATLPTPAVAAAPGAASAASRERTAFVQQLWPHAEQAAQALGVSPRTLIAQAALETDWGRRMIRQSDGTSSLNFFGIKADKRWDGGRASSVTHEYMNGQKHTETAQFRSYGSIAEGFADYVHFIRDNPRYRGALEHAGSDRHYARGLQQAGYATDPDYAAKIERVAHGTSLEHALAGSIAAERRT